MLKVAALNSLVLVLARAILAKEMLPEDMRNPVNPQNHVYCNLPEDRTPVINGQQKHFICDPDKTMKPGEVETLNWVLVDAARNGTRCPCSNHFCETHTGYTGYHIGVAVVRKMKIQETLNKRLNSPQDQSQIFAHALESEHWKFGNCEDDIVILYSVEDQILNIYGGKTAVQNLSPKAREVAAVKAGKQLSEGNVFAGLNMLLRDIKHVVNCDRRDVDDLEYCNIPYQNAGSGESTLLATSLLTSTLAAACAVYNHL